MITNPKSFAIRIAVWTVIVVGVLLWLLHRGQRLAREHVAASAPASATAATPAAAPKVPLDMVGVWTSTRADVTRCIELGADGTWTMVPNTEAGDRFAPESGTWRVDGEEIVWHSNAGGPDDRNRMLDVRDGHFSTLEADQSQARFERILAGASARCPRER